MLRVIIPLSWEVMILDGIGLFVGGGMDGVSVVDSFEKRGAFGLESVDLDLGV